MTKLLKGAALAAVLACASIGSTYDAQAINCCGREVSQEDIADGLRKGLAITGKLFDTATTLTGAIAAAEGNKELAENIKKAQKYKEFTEGALQGLLGQSQTALAKAQSAASQFESLAKDFQLLPEGTIKNQVATVVKRLMELATTDTNSALAYNHKTNALEFRFKFDDATPIMTVAPAAMFNLIAAKQPNFQAGDDVTGALGNILPKVNMAMVDASAADWSSFTTLLAGTAALGATKIDASGLVQVFATPSSELPLFTFNLPLSVALSDVSVASA